ncbi:MAG: peptide chain release factor 2 [Gemmatimonadota bacterium]|nr:MAG: peptide chain release factor 2 [Gemmatimonadota bacterium]
MKRSEGRWPPWRRESPTSGGIFDVDERRGRIKKLEEVTTQEGFWDRAAEAQRVLRDLKLERDWVTAYDGVHARHEDLSVLAELAAEESDESAEAEARAGVAALEKSMEALEVRSLFRDEADARAAIVNINPGAGGVDSQDWTEMLLRMYLRWAESRGFETEIVNQQFGDEAGLKSVSVIVRGEYAYGYMKVETGVHRLVRISPFDAQHRRHTSFASVFVFPEADDDVEIEIDESDLRVDTFRASGAGGQHVNKTDSAIRITHEPTGVVVTCQTERSQHRNRDTAMKLLKSRLYERKREEERKEREKLEESKGENAWGNQIRSYVFQPYTLVKDHRLNLENGNLQAVMDGDLDLFIEAALMAGIGSGGGATVKEKK